MKLSRLREVKKSTYALPEREMIATLTERAIANASHHFYADRSDPFTKEQVAATATFLRVMTKDWQKGGEWNFPGPDASDVQLLDWFAFTADYMQSLDEYEAEIYGDNLP